MVQLVQAAAHYVFAHAFVDAMRPTILLPISIVLLAALSTAFVRTRRPAASEAADVETKAVA